MTTSPQKISVVPDAAGLFWESRVAEALGVPRKLLARLRRDHLREPGDFVHLEDQGNAVALTAAGLATIEAQLARLATNPPPTAPEPAAAKQSHGKAHPRGDIPSGPPPREKMTVSRVARDLPRVLLCVPLSRPVQVTVRVNDNSNFAPGMVLEAIQSSDGVWQFRNRVPGDESTVGRLPRGKGRW